MASAGTPIGEVRRIESLSRLPDVVVNVPGSKSLTNRYLLLAALATGRSSIERALGADDIEAMVDCARSLGAAVARDESTARIVVEGVGGAIAPRGSAFARQSGTTACFVAAVLATAPGPWVLDGDAQLQARPMGDLFDVLRELGARVEARGDGLPVTLYGPLIGRRASVRGSVSSQFLSGLLVAGALLPDGLDLALEGGLVSAPYVEMTIDAIRRFGGEIDDSEAGHFVVARRPYEAADVEVEPDASSASYFLAAGALTGGRVGVRGLGAARLQGEIRFAEVLSSLGVKVDRDGEVVYASGDGPLHSADVDMSDMSDLVPTLAVVAAGAEGTTRIRGVGFIRGKESDRIAATVAELRRLGSDAREDPDGMTIRGTELHGGRVHTYDDHRIAMAFSVLGLRVSGIEIEDPGCVAKSFPTFFEVLAELY